MRDKNNQMSRSSQASWRDTVPTAQHANPNLATDNSRHHYSCINENACHDSGCFPKYHLDNKNLSLPYPVLFVVRNLIILVGD